jgi:uncharacterized protein RhaS with RHS repeats
MIEAADDYNIFRWYRSIWGSFFSQPDPMDLTGGLNLYSYGERNPLSSYDPTGYALALAQNEVERRFLARRVAELTGA